jgi:hypothetical protein
LTAELLLLLGGLCWRGLPLDVFACLLFFCLGQGLFHASLHPDLPDHHARYLHQKIPISLIGVVQSRPIPNGGDCRLELAARLIMGD